MTFEITNCSNMPKPESAPALRWLLGALLFLLLLGCGKKAPPRPYDATVPQPISDLEGVVRGGQVFLIWSLPHVARDESEVAVLKEFRVLREEAPLGEEWCEECPERLEPFDVLRIDEEDRFSLSGERVIYQDKRVSFGHIYVYRVISISARGYESDLSNRAVIYWDTPPDTPSRVDGSAGDRVVALRWEPVQGAEGYRIYRRQEGEEFGDVPIVGVGPKETAHRDTDVSNDLAYHYVVRATRRLGTTWLEGLSSEEISLIPKDLTPPEPPQGLLVIPLAAGIELSWQRNTEPDLLGYFVHRRDRAGGEYSRLNERPLEAPIYVDRTAVLNQFYEYVVTAVDGSPQRNESVFSESVSLNYVR